MKVNDKVVIFSKTTVTKSNNAKDNDYSKGTNNFAKLINDAFNSQKKIDVPSPPDSYKPKQTPEEREKKNGGVLRGGMNETPKEQQARHERELEKMREREKELREMIEKAKKEEEARRLADEAIRQLKELNEAAKEYKS